MHFLHKLFLMGSFFSLFSLAFAQDEIQVLKNEIEALKKKVDAMEKSQAEKQEYPAKAEGGRPIFDVVWNDGLFFETQDRKFSFTVRGRAYADFGFVHEDEAIQDTPGMGKMEDYAEFRSVRLGVGGTLHDRFSFLAEFDFVGQVSFKDVFVGIKKLPLNGAIQLGHFKEPFSLEDLTSFNYITFLERGAAVSALSLNRNLGIAYYANPIEEITFALGLFRETGENPPRINTDSGAYAFTTRATAVPFLQEGGKRLFHLGIAYSFRNPLNDAVRYRATPECNGTGVRFLDTGNIAGVEGLHLLGIEGALVLGPLSLQSEFICSWIRPEGGNQNFGTEHFFGYYIFASFFVTGEHRPYKTSAGVFDRAKPARNLFEKDGWGAVELTARYSKLNLEGDDVRGGRMDDFTFGVNWYWNPNMRVMVNYVYSLPKNRLFGDAELVDAHLLIARFQVNF